MSAVTLCPVCRLPVTASSDSCPECGASAVDRARLTSIAARRTEISAEQRGLLGEDAALAVEAREVTRRVRSASAEPAATVASGESGVRISPTGEPTRGYWRTERVRDALLWLGGGLLALSAVSLAAVLWSRDQPAGKPLLTAPRVALLLLVATFVVAVATRLVARRLPATAEVTGTLMLALAGTDWYVARRAGVGRDLMSIEAWIATGAFVLCALAVMQRRVLRLRAPFVTAPVLGLTGLGVAVLPLSSSSTTVSFLAVPCSALCAAGASYASRTKVWSSVAITLVCGAAAFEIIAIVGALTTLRTITEDGIQGDDRGLALAVLALALPFVVLLVLERRRLEATPNADDVMKTDVALAVVGSATVALIVRMDTPPFLAAMAWLGGATVAAGLARPRFGRAVATVGLGALCVGGALVVARSVNALLLPLGWWTDPWSLSMTAVARDHLAPVEPAIFHDWWWAVAAALGVITSGIVVARLASPAPKVRSAAHALAVVGGLTTAIYLLPMAAAGAVWLLLVVQLVAASSLIVVASALQTNKRAVALAGSAAIIAFGASAWGLSTVPATIAYFITISVVAALASVLSSASSFRRGMISVSASAGVAAAASVVLGATRGLGPTAFATSCTGAALVLAATVERRARNIAIESVGIVSTLIGVGLAAELPGWLASAATAAVIAACGAAFQGGALFRDRQYRLALPLTIALTGAAWLAAAGIDAIEAYSIPLGVALLITGALARNWFPQLGSWAAYTLGLVLGLLPSLVIFLDRGGYLRLIGLIAAGTLSVVVGATHRLQAPILLGASVVVTIGIDALSPVAADVPRWIPIGTAGLLILWIGITFERRLNNARHLRDNVRSLR